MSSITKDQAETQADIANNALTDAANTRFIDATDIQIQKAIAQGEFFVNCECFDPNIDPKIIFDYYTNLGYGVTFPDYPTNLMLQPAQLFGEFWINFWTNNLIPANVKTNPLRFLISWKP